MLDIRTIREAHSETIAEIGEVRAAEFQKPPFEVTIATEDPGAALETQDQAGVVADRVIGIGVVHQQQRAFGFGGTVRFLKNVISGAT